eukprot:COSAG01_NODE_639_length_14598_cov_316.689841_15_plen_50_part_00
MVCVWWRVACVQAEGRVRALEEQLATLARIAEERQRVIARLCQPVHAHQ